MKAAIIGCVSPYYNLQEWGDRYVITVLGPEMEDFPGKGNGNHPPRSPLKEYFVSSDEEEDQEDGEGSDEGRGGRGTVNATSEGINAGGREGGGGGGGGGGAASRPRKSKSSSGGARFKNRLSDVEGGYDEAGSSEGGEDGINSHGSDAD